MSKTVFLAYRELGAKRFRETFGLCYEDFEIGDVFEHRPGRTITDEHRPGNTVSEVDNILLALLTMNIQAVFLDEAFATNRESKERLIDSTLTVALLTAMSVRTVGANVVANLGWDKVKATHPVFVGDTLYAESTVLSKRESVSQPTQGIVTVSTRGLNQDGEEVMNFERSMLIYKRRHSPEAAAEN